MNLDRKIEILRKVAFERQSLEAVENVYGEFQTMLCEIADEADRIRGIVPPEKQQKKGEGNSNDSAALLQRLLEPDGIEFVRNAYLKVLGRAADPAGEEYFFTRLNMLEMEKEEVLHALVVSEEGQERGAIIPGLDVSLRKIAIRRRLFQIPIAGKISRYFYNLSKTNRKLTRLIFRFNLLEKNMQIQSDKLLTIGRDLENQNERIKRQREDLESQKKDLELYGKSLSECGENLRNNNILLEKHENLLENPFRSMQKDVEMLSSELASLKSKSARMTMINDVSDKGDNQESPSIQSGSVEKRTVDAVDAYNSIDYFDFENHFRGSRDHIKKVQEIYLPYFEGRQHVLDLGCGRGEFTELLTEHGVGVTGVDLYSPYVAYMKMRELPAVCEDAIRYLDRQDTCDGIFLGQVVEHISVQQIIELCRLAYQKLIPGNYLIMETPNPMCLSIYTESFYIDPSHNKPVHPKTLQYLAQKAGFSSVDILFTESSRMPYQIPALPEIDEEYKAFNTAMKQLSEMMFGSQDYAIIARK